VAKLSQLSYDATRDTRADEGCYFGGRGLCGWQRH
jgi:hypothetical protein